jgi:hypothetical protein
MQRYALIVFMLIARTAFAEVAPTGMVRVAAIQCPSVMGKTAESRGSAPVTN